MHNFLYLLFFIFFLFYKFEKLFIIININKNINIKIISIIIIYYKYNMLPLHLEILLKLKVAELFGNIPIINKDNNINIIHYKNIIPDTKQHHNNLIGKIVCNKFDFYYSQIPYIVSYRCHK